MVDNLPTVPPEKVDKLTTVLKKLFGQIGTIREGQRQAHTVPPSPLQWPPRNRGL